MERLDKWLVEEGVADTRSQAKRWIEEGGVMVNGKIVRKGSRGITSTDQVEVTMGQQFVSRAGDKLEAALSIWEIPVEGKRCLDVGCSTGGFMDCLLQRGAGEVVGIDVGHGQLHERLVVDDRVELHEGVNARHVKPGQLGDVFDLVVVDVSFISLKLVLPAVLGLAKDEGELVCLVKPQFEVGKENLGKGGLVKSEVARIRAFEGMQDYINGLEHWKVHGQLESPVIGGDGNRRILLYVKFKVLK